MVTSSENPWERFHPFSASQRDMNAPQEVDRIYRIISGLFFIHDALKNPVNTVFDSAKFEDFPNRRLTLPAPDLYYTSNSRLSVIGKSLIALLGRPAIIETRRGVVKK